MAKYCNERLINDVKEELPNVDELLIRDVVKFQGSEAERTVKMGAFETFSFKYLGKLVANLRKVYVLNTLNRKK